MGSSGSCAQETWTEVDDGLTARVCHSVTERDRERGGRGVPLDGDPTADKTEAYHFCLKSLGCTLVLARLFGRLVGLAG